MTPAAPVTVLVRRTETAAGIGVSVDLGNAGAGINTLRVSLDVLSPTGPTPSLTVFLETSPDALEWRAAGAWPAKTAPGSELRVFQPVERFVRARWELSGAGAAATFAIAGQKRRSFVTLEWFRGKMNSRLFEAIPDATIEQALATASTKALGYFSGPFNPPILSWDDDTRDAVKSLAVWDLLSDARGFNPEAGGDIAVRMNRDDAVRWLGNVASNNVKPQGIVDSTPEVFEGGAFVVSSRPRGW